MRPKRTGADEVDLESPLNVLLARAEQHQRTRRSAGHPRPHARPPHDHAQQHRHAEVHRHDQHQVWREPQAERVVHQAEYDHRHGARVHIVRAEHVAEAAPVASGEEPPVVTVEPAPRAEVEHEHPPRRRCEGDERAEGQAIAAHTRPAGLCQPVFGGISHPRRLPGMHRRLEPATVRRCRALARRWSAAPPGGLCRGGPTPIRTVVRQPGRSNLVTTGAADEQRSSLPPRTAWRCERTRARSGRGWLMRARRPCRPAPDRRPLERDCRTDPGGPAHRRHAGFPSQRGGLDPPGQHWVRARGRADVLGSTWMPETPSARTHRAPDRGREPSPRRRGARRTSARELRYGCSGGPYEAT